MYINYGSTSINLFITVACTAFWPPCAVTDPWDWKRLLMQLKLISKSCRSNLVGSTVMLFCKGWIWRSWNWKNKLLPVDSQTSTLHTSKASSHYVLLWHGPSRKEIGSDCMLFSGKEEENKKKMSKLLGFGGDDSKLSRVCIPHYASHC